MEQENKGWSMRVIGITGGVGAGKTQILQYLQAQYPCRILLADEAARQLQEPGGVCYAPLLALLGQEVLGADGRFMRGRMAELIFQDRTLLEQVNAIVHPAVKTYILEEIEKERTQKSSSFFFLEAALLIECGYESIVDELWYIDTRKDVRRERLKKGRGYSDERIDSILKSQLPEEIYRSHCSFVVDNSEEIAYAYEQIDRKMGEYPWKE